MTTAAALEALTDRSRFELLATGVLRAAEPDYAAITHTGLNARGESVAAPVDGLHRIPFRSPSEWVIVQHTTTSRGGLRSKWLKAITGDIAKAAQQARKIRRADRTARVKLVLTSNERVDADLRIAVDRTTEAANMQLDVWEQSRLAAFLDERREGHWLRKLYLGIEAERLSRELLHSIGWVSLEAYRGEELLPTEVRPITRPVTERVLQQLRLGTGNLTLLVGESGFGKTVVASAVLSGWLALGRLGLWMPARYLSDGIDAGVNGWLRQLYPSLEPDGGRAARELAATSGGLLLVVDDINRAADPARLLRMLVSATTPLTANEGEKAGSDRRAPVSIVAPVWPDVVRSSGRNFERSDKVSLEYLERFLPQESRRVLGAALPKASRETLEVYRERLGDDPLLVGLFSEAAAQLGSGHDAVSVAHDVLGRFVDARIAEVVRDDALSLLPRDVEAALTRLASEMLKRRMTHPRLEEVEEWFRLDADPLRGIRLMLKRGSLCKLDESERLTFRHDRLRDYLLARAATKMLMSGAPAADVLSDPFFESVVGEALASGSVSTEVLNGFRSAAPWALFAALRFVRSSTSCWEQKLFDEALRWAEDESGRASVSVLAAVSWSLLATDSPRVIEIVDALGGGGVLCEAALRNGSAKHGVEFCERFGRGMFEPGVNDPRRDSVIEHARGRFGERIRRDLQTIAAEASLPVERGAGLLDVLGHFGFEGFDEVIDSLYRRFGCQILSHSLWAALRCPLAEPARTLLPLLECLAEMPVRADYTEDLTERQELMQELGFACRRGIARGVVPTLLEFARRDVRLRDDVASMVEGTDDPEAVAYVVRYIASGHGSSVWEWVGSVSDREQAVTARSKETNERLRQMWLDAREDEKVRKTAFEVWLMAGGCTDVNVLREFGGGSPFRSAALQFRVKQGDLSAAKDVIELLGQGRRHDFWWLLAHRVWCEELASFVRRTLADRAGRTKREFLRGDESFLPGMLVKIPVADAEKLLQENWAHLRYDTRMIQVALRLGTPIGRALGAEAMNECPSEVDVFRHAFGLGPWSRARSDNPLRVTHLRGIEPYLARMSEQELLHVAWEVEREPGADEETVEWLQKFVLERVCPDSRKWVRSATESLLRDLNEQVQESRFPPYLGFAFERARGGSLVGDREAVGMVRGWLPDHPTVRGLQVAGECLRYVGQRADLGILDETEIVGDADAIKRIKNDVRFAVMKRSAA